MQIRLYHDQNADYPGGEKWVNKNVGFINHWSWCSRQQTKISYKFPEDLEKNVTKLQGFVIKLQKCFNYSTCMDETLTKGLTSHFQRQ